MKGRQNQMCCALGRPAPWRRLLRFAANSVVFTSVLWAGAACESTDNPRYAPPKPNYSQFVTFVQPVLGRRCASAACHGDPHRSLKLYAVDFLRAPPEFAETPLDENRLTEAELTWNYDAIRNRLRGVTALSNCKLLLKCLPLDQGGIRHGTGFDVFASRTDPDYKLFADWIDWVLP